MTHLQKTETLVLPPEFSSWMEYAEHYTRHAKCNEELMRLGFGCEVIRKEDDNTGVIISTFEIARDPSWVMGYYVEFNRRKALQPFEHFSDYEKDEYKILGKPAHLEYYLRVLRAKQGIKGALGFSDETMEFETSVNGCITFNLTTGRPATEEDARKYIELVS